MATPRRTRSEPVAIGAQPLGPRPYNAHRDAYTAAMTQTAYPELFAVAVAARRRQLELSIDALHTAGGPTKPVVIRAESAEYSNPRPSTLDKFDKGLSWKAGTAAGLYWNGVHPDFLTRSVPVGTQHCSVPSGALELLLSANTELQKLVRTSELSQQPNALLESVQDLDRAVEALCAVPGPDGVAASFDNREQYREFALSLVNLQHPAFSF